MRRQISNVKLSVLELQQAEAKRLIERLDDITQRAHELLDLRPDVDGEASDHVSDYLNGRYTPEKLTELLGIEVTP